jgi:hypothetical protein
MIFLGTRDGDSVEKVGRDMKSRPTALLGICKVLVCAFALLSLALLGMVAQAYHPVKASRVDNSPNAPVATETQDTTKAPVAEPTQASTTQPVAEPTQDTTALPPVPTVPAIPPVPSLPPVPTLPVLNFPGLPVPLSVHR